MNILEKTLGKNNEHYQHVNTISLEIKKSMDQRIPKEIPSNVYQASQWANGFANDPEPTFFNSKIYTDKVMFEYQKRKEAVPASKLVSLLNDELKAFDKRYQPVYMALKKIKPTTRLLNNLLLLNFLFINALESPISPAREA